MLLFLNNPKDLDPSYKIALDLGLFWKEKSASYRNNFKYWDRQVWANSADPDQTAPHGAVWSGSSLFVILSASFEHNTAL